MRWRTLALWALVGLCISSAALALSTVWWNAHYVHSNGAKNETLTGVLLDNGRVRILRPLGGLDAGWGVEPSKSFYWYEALWEFHTLCHWSTNSNEVVAQIEIPFLPVAFCAGIGAAAIWRAERRRLGVARGLCAGCGYDRRSLAAGIKCPECGTLPGK